MRFTEFGAECDGFSLVIRGVRCSYTGTNGLVAPRRVVPRPELVDGLLVFRSDRPRAHGYDLANRLDDVRRRGFFTMPGVQGEARESFLFPAKAVHKERLILFATDGRSLLESVSIARLR